MAQKKNQDMKDKPLQQHTQKRFPPPGKSSGPDFVKGLPTSLHVIFQTPAVEKQTSLQPQALVLKDFVSPGTQTPRPRTTLSFTDSMNSEQIVQHAHHARSTFVNSVDYMSVNSVECVSCNKTVTHAR